MIKLFRKIRYKFFSEAKFRKYLVYAVGEIVLVVLGILIALQINNWNEYRKERQKETELLLQIQTEYQSNLEQLDEKIRMRNDLIKSGLTLMEYQDFPNRRNEDSILAHLEATRIAPTFDPINDDIIGSGQIHLIQNKKLKNLLTRWSSEVVQVTEEEVLWNNYRLHHYYPFLAKLGLLRTLEYLFWEKNTLQTFQLDKRKVEKLPLKPSLRSPDISSLFENPEFESHLAYCSSLNALTNSQSLALRKNIIEILSLIDEELTK